MTTVTFPSQEVCDQALNPFPKRRFADVKFKINPHLPKKPHPVQRNRGIGDLKASRVFQNAVLSVYLPQYQHVPHHLVIEFPHTVKLEEKSHALHSMIKKIEAIYASKGILGFAVIEKEGGIVEIMPHLPGNDDVCNIHYMGDRNRHMLFAGANLTHPICSLPVPEPQEWEGDLAKEWPPLPHRPDLTYPVKKYSANTEAFSAMQWKQWTEMIEDWGGTVSPIAGPTEPELLIEKRDLRETSVSRCVFCDEDQVRYQLIFERLGICLLNNTRSGDIPGSSFLIISRRHFNHLTDLTSAERVVMDQMEGILKDVLHARNPDRKVVTYVQDSPATGQTVFHYHKQVISLPRDDRQAAWRWITKDLFPKGNISEGEMGGVIREINPLIRAKYDSFSPGQTS